MLTPETRRLLLGAVLKLKLEDGGREGGRRDDAAEAGRDAAREEWRDAARDAGSADAGRAGPPGARHDVCPVSWLK